MTNDSPRQKHDERPSADVSHSLADIAAQVGGDLRVDGPAAHGIALSTVGVRAGDLFVAAAGAISMKLGAARMIRRFGFRRLLIANGLLASASISVRAASVSVPARVGCSATAA